MRLCQLILSLLLALLPLTGRAVNIDTLFAHVPPAVLDLLDQTSRLDLLDLYNHGMEARAENIYGGQSQMTEKTASSLTLRLTDVSTWQLRLLPDGRDTLIACIHSVTAGATGSQLKLYNRHWQRVNNAVPSPALALFLKAPSPTLSATTLSIARTMLRSAPVQMKWEKTRNLLVCTISTESLPDEDQQRVAPCLRPLHYLWEGGRFVLQEKQAASPRAEAAPAGEPKIKPAALGG